MGLAVTTPVKAPPPPLRDSVSRLWYTAALTDIYLSARALPVSSASAVSSLLHFLRLHVLGCCLHSHYKGRAHRLSDNLQWPPPARDTTTMDLCI